MNAPMISLEVIDELDVDIDGDNEVEHVEIVKARTKHAIAARWKKTLPNGEKEEICALADRFLLRSKSDDRLEAIHGEVKARINSTFRDRTSLPAKKVGLAYSAMYLPKRDQPGDVVRSVPDVRAFLEEGDRIELDYVFKVHKKEPNDESFSLQAALQKIGAPVAWEHHQGSREIKVAVVDTGIDSTHPDLERNIFREPETDKIVGWGWDYEAWEDAASEDDNSHGTLCAGIIGAIGNNGRGIAGVNWRVSLMPLKAFDEDGLAAGSKIAEAIQFAIDKEADVILCAFGSPAEPSFLREVLERANKEKILVVASAGNTDRDLDANPLYPASFLDLDNLITVGGCDEYDDPVFDWGHSQKRVHLSAPGKKILTTVPTRFRPYMPYSMTSGTSPAAAFVAGACALLKSYIRASNVPTNGTEVHHFIRKLLLDNVAKNPRLTGASASGGRLDLAAALSAILPRSVPGREASELDSVSSDSKAH